MSGEQSRWQVFLGFILALVLSAIGFFLSIPIGFGLGGLLEGFGLKGPVGDWIFPLSFAVILLVAGLLVTRQDRSALRQGLIIGFSVVFLLNGACWAFQDKVMGWLFR